MFAPGEVSRIYINFPDPWKKSRQYKRRLTYAGFLALYANVLPLGGAGVHVPYAITWAHEAEHAVDAAHPRLRVAASLAQVPSAIAELSAA